MSNLDYTPISNPQVEAIWNEWIPYPPQHSGHAALQKAQMQQLKEAKKAEDKFNQNLKEWDEWLAEHWKGSPRAL